MSGTVETLRSPDRLPRRDLASDPPPINPVISAAGLSSTVTVGLVDYVARWAGYDTEKCIEKALEDGVIKLEHKSDWRSDHDVYRLTSKGLGQSGKHMRDVFERSARMARLDYEEDLRKGARTAGAAAAGPGRPPPLAAGELIPPICQFKGNCRRRAFCLVVGGAAEPAEIVRAPARRPATSDGTPRRRHAARCRYPPCAGGLRRGGLGAHRRAKAARRRILTVKRGFACRPSRRGSTSAQPCSGCTVYSEHPKPRLQRRRDGRVQWSGRDCRRQRPRLRQHSARWGRG